MPSVLRGDDDFDTDLPFVIEQSFAGDEWYRKWSDGFIEQGGVVNMIASSSIVVNLPNAYTTEHISNIALLRTGAADSTILSTNSGSLTQFTIFANATATISITWESKGY